MSLFSVERKRIIEIAEIYIKFILEKRKQFYNNYVDDVMEANDGKSFFGKLFRIKPMTREQAEREVSYDFLMSPWSPSWAIYKCDEKSRAQKLLHACEITSDDVIQLDVDDAACLHEMETELKGRKLIE